MSEGKSIVLFDDKKVCRHWDSDAEELYFSIIDILTDSATPKRYWSDLKRKLKAEGSEVYENIVRLKMVAPDGKKHATHILSFA